MRFRGSESEDAAVVSPRSDDLEGRDWTESSLDRNNLEHLFSLRKYFIGHGGKKLQTEVGGGMGLNGTM